MDQVDFIEKHQKLRESADRVLGLSHPQKEFIDNTNITLFGGATTFSGIDYRAARFGGKTMTTMWHNYYQMMQMFPSKRRKLLQSSSKQSRIISVVCK